MHASDIMSTKLIVVHEDENIQEAAKKMVEHDISVLPVVDANNILVGIVTESDFVGKAANIPRAMASIKQLLGRNYYFADVEDIYKTAKERSVSEVMSKPPKTIPASMPLTEVVNFMIKNHLKRLPVTDDNNNVIGIVTRRDLLKAFAEMDGN